MADKIIIATREAGTEKQYRSFYIPDGQPAKLDQKYSDQGYTILKTYICSHRVSDMKAARRLCSKLCRLASDVQFTDRHLTEKELLDQLGGVAKKKIK